jgi:hypothetical protein
MTDEPKRRGRPPKATEEAAPVAAAPEPEMVEIICSVPNVWTSEGKILRGDAITLPIDEARALVKAGKAYKEF